MAEGSPVRWVLASLFIVVLAGGLAWAVWGVGDADSAAPPTERPTPAAGSEPPAPAPEPADEDVPSGPATGDFAELATAAELEHPDTDPHIRRWYDWFGYFIEDEQIAEGEWRNKEELWDQLVVDVREATRDLGAPFEHPLYEGDTAQPATVDVRWSTEDTGGRGEAVELSVTYLGENGRISARYWAVLVEVARDESGEVIAEMAPFDLQVTDYEDFASFRAASGERIWSWVQEQEADR